MNHVEKHEVVLGSFVSIAYESLRLANVPLTATNGKGMIALILVYFCEMASGTHFSINHIQNVQYKSVSTWDLGLEQLEL